VRDGRAFSCAGGYHLASQQMGELAMLRFSIRDLLWAMLVIGMGLAWRRDHAEFEDERLALRQSLAKIQEIRQMLGDKGLNRLVGMAQDYNQAPTLPNTLVISMRDGKATAKRLGDW
jgi:hypothetical protein